MNKLYTLTGFCLMIIGFVFAFNWGGGVFDGSFQVFDAFVLVVSISTTILGMAMINDGIAGDN